MRAETSSAKPTDEDSAAIERFLDRLWLERGLSRNTQASYRSDLSLFARWLAARGTPLAGAAEVDLREYFAAARRRARVRGCWNCTPATIARLTAAGRRAVAWVMNRRCALLS